MNQMNVDNQPDQHTPKSLNGSQSPASPGLAAASTKPEKTQPNRLQRFFRKALTWLVVLAIFFLAGFAVDHYLRYKPLQDELNTTTAHLTLLKVQGDVSNARLALCLNDVEGAKAALSNTQQRLENLVPRIANFDASLAQSMPQRLNLIFSGLGRDPETAKIDLDLFSKDLLKIEAALFNN
jgi:hypothetical protein